jgi:hypothetical protein
MDDWIAIFEIVAAFITVGKLGYVIGKRDGQRERKMRNTKNRAAIRKRTVKSRRRE